MNPGRMVIGINEYDFCAIWLTDTCMLEFWIDTGTSYIEHSIREPDNMDVWLKQDYDHFSSYQEIK